MRRIVLATVAGIAAGIAGGSWAQMMPGGGGMGGGRTQMGGVPQSDTIPTAPAPDKPDIAAKKAFKAGSKSLDKARDLEDQGSKATDPDKRAGAFEKARDNYYRALDEFTEALSNDANMVEAWNSVGLVHLRLGAFGEAIDDYNHALTLKPDLEEATLHRAEAYLGVDRLDEAKGAYMELFNHERAYADELLAAMQKWLVKHQTDAGGMSAKSISSFDQWVKERDAIAKQPAA